MPAQQFRHVFVTKRYRPMQRHLAGLGRIMNLVAEGWSAASQRDQRNDGEAWNRGMGKPTKEKAHFYGCSKFLISLSQSSKAEPLVVLRHGSGKIAKYFPNLVSEILHPVS
jgi:hypothetical protein